MWYPNLTTEQKMIQILQSKRIHFCLYLENRHHISTNDLKEINWLPTRERFEQCVCVSTFKFWKGQSPAYMSDIYNQINIPTVLVDATGDSNYPLKIHFRDKKVSHI